MTPGDERFARQVRLREVGLEGQARLLAAEVVLCEGNEARVASDYLRRAGVRARHAAHAPTPSFPHGTWYGNAACRELAAGAWLALEQIRRTLAVSSP